MQALAAPDVPREHYERWVTLLATITWRASTR